MLFDSGSVCTAPRIPYLFIMVRLQIPGSHRRRIELEVMNTELSPDVRRMLAVVGHQAPFEQGRQQMELASGRFIGQAQGRRAHQFSPFL